MRRKSHIAMGKYLLEHHMPNVGSLNKKAFIFGCIQPDHNAFTYLKGSFRCQWLRGHNYCNASRYIRKLLCRLVRKKSLSVWDYYALGKLIHYTCDAFTLAHNDSFSGDLYAHRAYEAMLQEYFLSWLQSDPRIDLFHSHAITESVEAYHIEYSKSQSSVHTDAQYALSACCCIISALIRRKI